MFWKQRFDIYLKYIRKMLFTLCIKVFKFSKMTNTDKKPQKYNLLISNYQSPSLQTSRFISQTLLIILKENVAMLKMMLN